MPKRRLLVVGWDSADWKIIKPLMQGGQMPTMQRIVAQGVHGDLRTLEPSLSPILWTTIATGRHAAEHGVHGFTEVREGRIVPVSAATRQCKAIWNILSERGLKTNLVSWFATQGEQDPNVKLVSNLFAHAPSKAPEKPSQWPEPPAGTYWPETLADPLSSLRLSPSEMSGEVLRMFVRDPQAIDQAKDHRLRLLAQKLAETFSVQAAATWLMEHDEWDLTMVYFRAIDEISHVFMPFHPPRMQGVPEQGFEHYYDVVNSIYRLHDLMLARLVDLAGPEAGVMVLSDHGFHSDHLRPRFVPNIPAGIVAWHRPFGILAACGHGFRKNDSPIFGASLPDITPTILGWFGLPRAQGMMGRVLYDSLESTEIPEDCDSYETPGTEPHGSASWQLQDDDRKAMLDHFVELGYIGELPSDNQSALEQTSNENRWQLACSLLHSGRHEEALPLLEEAYDASPLRPDIAQRLTQCLLHFGLTEQATKIIDASVLGFKSLDAVGLIRASIAQQMEEPHRALEYLQEVQNRSPNYVGLREQLAMTYLDLRRWDDAEKVVREILELDSGYARGWAILSRCQLHRNENEACIESALEAIDLNFSSPMAHINLGLALSRTHRYLQAANAFRNAIRLAPLHPPTYRFLSAVYKLMGMYEESNQMLDQARRMRQQAKEQQSDQRDRIMRAAMERESQRLERPATQILQGDEPLDLTIVSGLPRSGTSVMMQILRAGGIEPMTDGQRQADEDNPEGYWEWEAIKRVEKEPGILKQANGKVIKVISALLPAMPRMHRYRIIYMTRPIEQVVASQFAMLKRKGIEPKQKASELAIAQEKHSQAIREAFKKLKQVELLEVDYTKLVSDPEPILETIADFLGNKFKLGPAVKQSIKPSLHRQR
jgi:predicted AlkP superfamily phosphohydrolase/phosphomutase/tetratricopeptide (TPR) repeat protein